MDQFKGTRSHACIFYAREILDDESLVNDEQVRADAVMKWMTQLTKV